jgi:hypothetical protein
MDAARQVLRFSIPGSLFLISMFGLIILGRVVAGQDLHAAIAEVAADISPAVAVLASIPVGFVNLFRGVARPRAWISEACRPNQERR